MKFIFLVDNAFLFTEKCTGKDIRILDELKYDARFPAENVLTRFYKEPAYGIELTSSEKTGIWLTPLNSSGYFVLDMGCQFDFNEIELVNVHNRKFRNMASKQIRLVVTLLTFITPLFQNFGESKS